MKRRALLLPLPLALALCAAACMRAAVSDGEREVLLRARDLAAYGFEFPEASRYESFNKTVYFDGSYDLIYEFEPPDDAAADSALYMNVTVTFEKSAQEARLVQGIEKFSLNAGMGLEGLKVEERKDFFRYGDASSFHVLTREGAPVGNYFVTREGAKVYSVLIAGFYFDDPEQWAELVTPRLQKFSALKP
ncbi:MAG TPA: hypothetical protein VG148_10675 [Pyrinomonadaceae bacterium]|nr:hypothetical protein [Pyrinomonadaceae bacterium]